MNETVEVSNLYAFGKIGTSITATPDYSQATNMSALKLDTLTFVDSKDADNNGTYPATPVKTKTVAGEGTWTINADGSITFTPEKGFAGHPTPVYYMAKNTNGKASTDDPTTPNKFGVGTINYEYSDTSGLIAQTTADQGVTQTPFDNGTEDKGFADATKMFRNIPADWWDGFKYALIDDNGNFVSSITVAGQGTYTINESTGMVTFVPLKQFSGMADTIQIGIQEGYKAINGATPAPVAEYTPIVKPGNVLVRDAYGSGSVGAPVTVKPNYTQLGTNPSPIDLSTVSFLDESGAYPATPIKEKKVEGQGTWTIKEDGSFTFTPEAGFAGTPTQQPYSASNDY